MALSFFFEIKISHLHSVSKLKVDRKLFNFIEEEGFV